MSNHPPYTDPAGRIALRDSDRRTEPLPDYADEIEEPRDSWVGSALIYLIATCAVMGLVAYVLG